MAVKLVYNIVRKNLIIFVTSRIKDQNEIEV